MNAATFTAAVLLLGTVPHDTGILRDRADCIEVNSFHDDEARLVFTQAMFLDWCKCRHHVADWRLVKNRSDAPQANIVVRRDYQAGGYITIWDDNGKIREVRAATYRETFSQTDPELADRDHHPLDRRRKLSDGREAMVE
jgi:hypothetical protein